MKQHSDEQQHPKIMNGSIPYRPFTEASGMRGHLTALAEIVAVLLVVPVGMVVGHLTGVIVLAPIGGTLAGVGVATLVLRRHGAKWSDLGFKWPTGRLRLLLHVLAGFVAATILVRFIAATAIDAMGFNPPDISLFENLIEGNLTNYLLFLVPVSWGSAAIGEELLARGFVLNRISAMTGYSRLGTLVAITAQAILFALGHLYQGPAGALNVFALGLVFGGLYVASNRNLIACMILHGLIDTIAITAVYLGYSEILSP